MTGRDEGTVDLVRREGWGGWRYSPTEAGGAGDHEGILGSILHNVWTNQVLDGRYIGILLL